MRKTDKKMDNQIRKVLTEVCDIALKDFAGFQWLTHLVNYADFPKTLQVVCVFDTNDELAQFLAVNGDHALSELIASKLSGLGIKLKDISKQIAYDTEERCETEHSGKWADRLG